MKNEKLYRREFLGFMGIAGFGIGSLGACRATSSVSAAREKDAAVYRHLQSRAVHPTSRDDLILAPGLEYQVLVSHGDIINQAGDTFGSNNDYLAFTPLNTEATEGILWVNHEYFNPLFIHGRKLAAQDKTKADVEMEMASVGGSFIHLVSTGEGTWRVQFDSPFNRRISGLTPIKFSNNHVIQGSSVGLGTLGNCAGGITPYGTILTCEENYDYFYGEVAHLNGARTLDMHMAEYGWQKYYPQPPEHYGWVVEIDPKTGAAEKLVELGRMAHECATVTSAPDGRLVVYTGDDKAGEHLYKFISDQPGTLKSGTLYVADFGRGEWISLNLNTNIALKPHFNTQLDVLIRCREAGKIVGATPLDRPEDIEIEASTGAVYISCSNNVAQKNYFGSIRKVVEKDNNPLSLNFVGSEFLIGGEDNGFACPDNLAFDPRGNLWVTTDISESAMHKPPYSTFGNNALFMIPMRGAERGKPIRMASAPIDAELTGPLFSADGATLFLSVQHPGSRTTDLSAPTSTWPSGTGPKSSVVAIKGFSKWI